MTTTKGGFVVWLTGLPGSGKTTIATILANTLRARGARVEILDGDEVRVWLSPEAGFSREDRERHLRRVAHVAHLLARNDVCVLASFVSPYRSSRDYARQVIKDFVEVYVDAPLEVCAQRDPKGLYRKAREGAIKDLTGPQDSYEPPANPEMVVHTERENPSQSADKILDTLRTLGYLDAHPPG